MADDSARNGSPRAPRTPNRALRAVRENERRETRAQFAEALTRVALETGGKVYPTEKYIERLESGEISWPRSSYRNILVRLCGRPIEELGFTPPVRLTHDLGSDANIALRDAIFASGMELSQVARKVGVSEKTIQRWISKGTVPHPAHRWKASRLLDRKESDIWPSINVSPEKFETEIAGEIEIQEVLPSRDAKMRYDNVNALEVDDVERRELFKIFGSLAIAAPFTSGIDQLRRNLDNALNSPTTRSDVEEWERVANQYSTDSGLVAPARLLPDLLTDLDEAQHRLQNAPDAFRQPMSRICGQLSALAAINLFNIGDERNSNRYWRTALRAISNSGSRSAQAEIYGQRAVFALYERRLSATDVLALSDDAISIANGTPCTGAANAYSARALTLAAIGKSSESVRTVHELLDVSARIPGVTSAALEAWGWSEQSLRFIESRVYAYSGRTANAAKANEAGLAIVPKGQYLAISQFKLNMAICMIAAGDPSEGARHIVRTLQTLPSGYRQSVPILDTATRALDLVPANAVNISAVSEARELLSTANGD